VRPFLIERNESFVRKTRPLREIPVNWKERGQARGGYYEYASNFFMVQTI